MSSENSLAASCFQTTSLSGCFWNSFSLVSMTCLPERVTSFLMGICPSPLSVCLLEKVQTMRSWSWSISKGLSLHIFGRRCSKESQTISNAALPPSMPLPQTLPTRHVHTTSDTTPLTDEAAHLREPQFDSPLFESLSKLFQLLQVAGFLRCSRWS